MQIESSNTRLFTSVFSEYKQRFVFFAASYLRDTSVAEDIVMESFMHYWENKDSLPQDINLTAYIFTVIKNKCINFLRDQNIHRNIEDKLRSYQERLLQENIISLESCDPKFLFSEEAQEIINGVLESLPEKTRDIFIRSRFNNQTYKEIAFDLNITEKSVEFHISKALKVFRIALRDYLPLFFYLLFHGGNHQ